MDELHYPNDVSLALARDPAGFLDMSYDSGFSLDPMQLEAAQLAGLRMRFEQLRPRVAALDTLATEQGISRLAKLEDVVALMFMHTAFKSYPLSWLDEGRFDRLTRWLSAFTSHGLPEVLPNQFHTVDDWVEYLDANSDVRLVHTFGTRGKLSWIPRGTREWDHGARILANSIRDFRGAGRGPDLYRRELSIVQPGYQYGASAATRAVEMMEKHFSSPERTLFLYPRMRFSADVVSLPGRLRASEARGAAGAVPVAAGVLARRKRFQELERRRPERMREFLTQLLYRRGGCNVLLFGVWPVLYDWARSAREGGVSATFGLRSVLITGGGTKGRNLPEGWREQVFDFLGFDQHVESYAMTELIAGCPRCEAGHYHVPPVIVPFVLDPVTREPLDRSRRATGRFAFVDLLAESTWSALITDDEVTLSGREDVCACGRLGRYIEADIRRYGVEEGGDDKVTCGGANEAHDRALDLLAEIDG